MNIRFDERTKHRLIGLVVIISIAVIFLPALMKHSNYRLDENVNVSVRLPVKPSLPKIAIVNEKAMFQTVKVAHVDIPIESKPPQFAVSSQATETDSRTVIPRVPNELALKQSHVSQPPIIKIDLSKKTALKSLQNSAKKSSQQVVQRYAVQLASFSNQVNAQSLVNQLAKKGYKASYIKANGKQGKLFYKVIVGDASQKNEAIDLQKKLANNLQLNGFIVKNGVS